ncbi:MAG: DUF11 domain-containing protein, partial [Anaerolineales bacterium]|nr:DUF11 domain-containing protein [Anaerolineales bacterium]
LVILFSLAMVAGLALAQEKAPEAAPTERVVQEQAPESVLATTYVYTATPSVAIPDNGCSAGTYATSTITVADSFVISDLNVGIWATHTWRSDMDFRLYHPDGTSIDLLLDPDGSADNLNALLDDSSPNAASSDTTNHLPPPPYYTAWYYPTGLLSTFNGKNAQGEWVIQVCDDAGGDTGSLNTWSMFFGSGLILDVNTDGGAVCEGNDVDYTFTVVNATAVTESFTLNYTSTWPYAGPTATSVLAPGESEDIVVTVHVPNTANVNDSDDLTVTVSGGGDSDQATVTTPASLIEGYTDYADVPTGRRTRDHSLVYYDGKLYKIGGYDGSARVYVDIYEIATNTWTTGADLPGARYWLDCTEIAGKIYCAGGYQTSAQGTLYIYDIATNTWSTGAAMPANRYGYAGAAFAGKYYVIGGYSGSAYMDTLLAYDPISDTWDITLPSMSVARRDGMAGVIGGKIYVTGGRSAASTYVNTTEVYDPALNAWSTAASLTTTGWVRAADAVKDDRYLMLLGGASADSSASNYALSYDAVDNVWRLLPTMDHLLYGSEAASDAAGNIWAASGRLYENGTFSYSNYTFKLDECGAANADLTCLKTDSADPVSYGELITYTIYVTNTGNADGWNTVVTDTLPAEVTFVSASPACTENLGIVTCDLGSLGNGQSQQLEVVVTAPEATVQLTNNVEVASAEDDFNLANNSDSETTQVTNASIEMVKTVGLDPSTCATTNEIDVLSGTEVVYCYEVTNTGLITFTDHTLVDSELGNILTGFTYSLAPNASVYVTQTAVLTETTINQATWTASDGILSVDYSDSATVNVLPATITLTKTVGTNPHACATANSVAVIPGTAVTYCYEVTNTSPGTLGLHDLVDSELGTILNGYAYALEPGASVFVTNTVTLNASVINTATWTAYNAGPIHVATAEASASVAVVTTSAGLPLEDFNAGTAGFPPAGWTILNNGGTCVWESTETTSSANLTGGDGYAAEANADDCGSGTSMNTELRTPFFNLTGATSPLLIYRYDYRDHDVADQGTVDISVDGGATWINLVTYLVSDRGPAQNLVDLSAYIDEPLLQIRFKYIAPGWEGWFQIDDVEVLLEAEPAIAVNPAELANAQLPDTIDTTTLNIANTGSLTLTWDIFEDTAPIMQTPLVNWADNFDSYGTGVQLHGLGGWKGWGNAPAAGALTSNAQARSVPNSVDVLTATDLVHEYDGYTAGKWVYTVWQYIPSSYSGQTYFILLNTYSDSGTNNWSVQLCFNSATGQLIDDTTADCSTGTAVSYVT